MRQKEKYYEEFQKSKSSNSISRENSMFKGSRLYRQSEEASNELLMLILTDENPYKKIIRFLSNEQEIITIKTKEELIENVNKTKKYIKDLSKSISTYIAIPVLVQSIDDFYYGENKMLYQERYKNMGNAMKRCITLIWDNVTNTTVNEDRSINAMKNIVQASIFAEMMEFLLVVFNCFGEYEFSCDYKEFHYTNFLLAVLSEFTKADTNGKSLYRTIGPVINKIYENPKDSIEAIGNILDGQSPRNQPVFKNTFFSEIPGEYCDFWAGIWLRIQLLIIAIKARGCVSNVMSGICIIEDIAIITNSFEASKFQPNVNQLFWTRKWYDEKSNEWESNLIVERPILRICRDHSLYVTSISAIIDSINWFVEASIMPYSDVGGVRLPENIFNKYISKHFENNVIEVFKKQGFKAGFVNENGVWSTGNENIVLENICDEICPGEIDLLAYNLEKKFVILGECKVLAHAIANYKKLRNILSKISDDDSELFHAKIRKKVEWITNTKQFTAIPEYNFAGIIILDKVIPGMHGMYEHQVMSLSEIKEAFESDNLDDLIENLIVYNIFSKA